VSGLDQKSGIVSEIQMPNSRHFIIGKRMSIARSRVYRAVPRQVMNCDQIDSCPYETKAVNFAFTHSGI
jgi:hypothetical protein